MYVNNELYINILSLSLVFYLKMQMISLNGPKWSQLKYKSIIFMFLFFSWNK